MAAGAAVSTTKESQHHRCGTARRRSSQQKGSGRHGRPKRGEGRRGAASGAAVSGAAASEKARKNLKERSCQGRKIVGSVEQAEGADAQADRRGTESGPQEWPLEIVPKGFPRPDPDRPGSFADEVGDGRSDRIEEDRVLGHRRVCTACVCVLTACFAAGRKNRDQGSGWLVRHRIDAPANDRSDGDGDSGRFRNGQGTRAVVRHCCCCCCCCWMLVREGRR
mmetsp:Transcript_13326/g.29663  ORF Transcript_13326/g.29663 Transcript_13326/m.29663 type:complete len:222 (-) Transcript_13326:688-1353(-)